jgi:hypothetical protein
MVSLKVMTSNSWLQTHADVQANPEGVVKSGTTMRYRCRRADVL